MTTNRLALLVGFCLVGLFAQDASAYYHAPMGRFLTRDPHGQPGFSGRIASALPNSTRGGFIAREPETFNSIYNDPMYGRIDFDGYYQGRMGRFSDHNSYPEVQNPPASRLLTTEPLTPLSPMSDFTYSPMAQYQDGMNLYQYVEGAPVARVDPSGLKWASCIIAGACLARQEAACAAACRWDPIWDDRRDTWKTCFLKCRKARLQGILKGISDAGCYAAVYGCGARALNEWAKKAGPNQLPKPVMEQGPQGPLAPLRCARR